MLRKIIESVKLNKHWFLQGGFTLVELMAVVIIITILASIALPKYYAVVEESRKAEAYTALGMILEAQKRYVLDYDDYTNVLTRLDINVTNPGRYFSYAVSSPDPFDSNSQAVANATRIGPSYSYTIAILENGTFME